MNWKQVAKNVTGTSAAGFGLAAMMAGVDWVTAAGIIFACIANLIGLLQQSPITTNDEWKKPPLQF